MFGTYVFQLRDQEREREFKKQRSEAIKAGIIEEKYFDRDGADNEEDSDSERDEMLSDGDLEEVAETEMNMMLQRIPATCTVEFAVGIFFILISPLPISVFINFCYSGVLVINPMPEARPFMSCMRSDEMKEKGCDDEDEEEETEKKEGNDDPHTNKARSNHAAGAEDGDGHPHVSFLPNFIGAASRQNVAKIFCLSGVIRPDVSKN
ncbi:unnamed protein product [Cylicostephanus goldi]|uniref:Uncharacterized protein n=1 Tax=Cylicostephanus goldi TaxID=71465 RepID=A0A3P6S0N0_CYLGO|nr:unnamed protein product [Cylicostephanus goldi]